MSNDTANSQFIGKIVDVALETSSLKNGAEGVISQLNSLISPMTMTNVSTYSLSAEQLAGAKVAPLYLSSVNALTKVLLPGTNTMGTGAGHFLCNALGLVYAGDAAILQFAQGGTNPTTLVLSGSADGVISTQRGITTVMIEAVSVGATTATVNISKTSYGAAAV